jgi:hypothetical protein
MLSRRYWLMLVCCMVMPDRCWENNAVAATIVPPRMAELFL